MAKKKVEAVSEDSNLSEMDKIEALIEKKFGAGILKKASHLLTIPQETISISPVIDYLFGGGITKGSWVVVPGKEKMGKAQPLDSIIYTPNGPKFFKDLSVGDEVCGVDNTLSKITGIYPQGYKDVYRVYFTNDDYVDCCEDHLWKIYHVAKKEWTILPLKDFINKLYIGKNKQRYRYSVELPICHFKEVEVDIDPYLMGLLLGDGSFRTGSLTFTTTDHEILNYIKTILDINYNVVPVSSQKVGISYRITQGNKRPDLKNKYVEFLKLYGLWNLNSKQKFIPDTYKYNSIPVRQAIIKGLMDTDGHIDKNGVATYSTSSIRLAKDFKEIIQSLGGLCKIYPKQTSLNGKIFNSWICRIAVDNTKELFQLNRKRKRGIKRNKPTLRKSITHIEKLRIQLECQCISIDNDNGLYVTNNCTTTHNTTTLLYALAKCQKAGMHCYFVNAEGRIKRRDLLGIKGLDVDTLGFIGSEEDHILTGEEYLEICNDILRNQRNVAMLIDSLSILSGQEKEKQLEFGKQTRGKFNQSLSGFCSGLSNVIPLKQHILMTTAHIISNTGGGMQTTSEKIGSGFGYQADFKIKTTYAPPWTVGSDENSEEIGKLIHWKCITSGLGSPGKSGIGRLRYGVGIDEVAENIDFAIDFGVISKKGSWFEYQEQKFQGFDNLREALSLEENVELYNKLVAEVKEML